MRLPTLIAFLFAALSATASQWKEATLGDLIARADLVVIGKIVSDEGRFTPSKPVSGMAHRWNSRLEVIRVLKGKAFAPAIEVEWIEVKLKDQPEYALGEERIWILSRSRDGNSFTTDGRPDTVLTIDSLSSVLENLKQ